MPLPKNASSPSLPPSSGSRPSLNSSIQDLMRNQSGDFWQRFLDYTSSQVPEDDPKIREENLERELDRVFGPELNGFDSDDSVVDSALTTMSIGEHPEKDLHLGRSEASNVGEFNSAIGGGADSFPAHGRESFGVKQATSPSVIKEVSKLDAGDDMSNILSIREGSLGGEMDKVKAHLPGSVLSSKVGSALDSSQESAKVSNEGEDVGSEGHGEKTVLMNDSPQ